MDLSAVCMLNRLLPQMVPVSQWVLSHGMSMQGGRHRRFRDNEEFLWACFASVSGRLRLEIGISDSLATLLIFLCFVK